MKKILVILAVLILLAAVGAVLYLGYLGFVPGLSGLFGSDKPRDLGVTYARADYDSADAKADVAIVVSKGNVPPEDSMVCTGAKQVTDSFSGAELTATINEHQGNWRYYPVSDVQLKIAADGSTQVSGMLRLDRLAGYAAATGASYANIKTVMDKFSLLAESVPFYLNATANVTNGLVDMRISSAEIGRAKIPQNLIDDHEGDINGFFTQQLSAFDGLSVKSLDFKDGQMNFDGTLPESVETFAD